MKVYIVHQIDYEVSEIIGVFASAESASACAADRKAKEEKRRASSEDLPRYITASWQVEEHEVKP